MSRRCSRKRGIKINSALRPTGTPALRSNIEAHDCTVVAPKADEVLLGLKGGDDHTRWLAHDLVFAPTYPTHAQGVLSPPSADRDRMILDYVIGMLATSAKR